MGSAAARVGGKEKEVVAKREGKKQYFEKIAVATSDNGFCVRRAAVQTWGFVLHFGKLISTSSMRRNA